MYYYVYAHVIYSLIMFLFDSDLKKVEECKLMGSDN